MTKLCLGINISRNYQLKLPLSLTFSRYDTSADYLIELLGWKKLDCQREAQKAVMVFSVGVVLVMDVVLVVGIVLV